jgi:hypothetical protein
VEGEAKSRVGEEVGSRQVRSGCGVIRTQTGRPIRDHGEDDSVVDREREEPSTPIREASAIADQRKSKEMAGSGEELKDNVESDTVSDVRFGNTGERANAASLVFGEAAARLRRSLRRGKRKLRRRVGWKWTARGRGHRHAKSGAGSAETR